MISSYSFAPSGWPTGASERRRRLVPLGQDGYLRFASDRIHKAIVEALEQGERMDAITETFLQRDGHAHAGAPIFWKAYDFSTDAKPDGNSLEGAIGFTREPGTALWRLLQQNGARAIQAHYSLMARAYEETDANPREWVPLSIPQFCDDLGYARLPNGAHRPENKRQVLDILHLLTRMELRAVYTPPGRPRRLIQGPLWLVGLEKYEEMREGTALHRWDPIEFWFLPGAFFRDEQWRANNRYVGLLGKGFLGLEAGDRDKWAIMVGGFLGALARMNAYRPLTLLVENLAEVTGLQAAYPHRPKRRLAKLAAALEKLIAVGVIGAWQFLKEGRSVEVTWPADLATRAEVLAQKKTAAIERHRSKRGRPKQRPQ
jgi:hypothetical protein